jgi:hypothetical protein
MLVMDTHYAVRSPRSYRSASHRTRSTVSAGECAAVESFVVAEWAALEQHFRHHATLVNRFRHANGPAVLRMWMTQTNGAGKRLSQFEREALVERHCELFGTWPD